MKESMVKTGSKLAKMAKNYSLRVVFAKAMYFISAVLISRGYILGSYYPFGLSLSASVSGRMLIPTLMGSVFVYLMPLRLGSGMRYISTVIAIAAIRWALSDVTKIKNHVLYTPLVVFMSSIVTGLAVNCADGVTFHGTMITLLECLVAAVATYFFDTSFKAIKSKKIYTLSLAEFVCIAISISISLLALSEISLHGVSIGRIFAVTLILISSYCFGVTGGSVAGISSGVIFALPSFGINFVSGSYAFAGMLSGAFAPFGKLAVCGAFIPAYAIVCFRSGDVTGMISRLYELTFGMIIFCSLPSKTFNFLKNICPGRASPESKNEGSKNKEAFWRLRGVSDCFSSMNCLDKVQIEALNPSKFGLEEACLDSIKSYCSSCGLRKLCWDKNCKSTYECMRKAIKETPEIDDFDSSANILGNCRKPENILQRIRSIKRDFSSCELVRSQAKEFKTIAQRYFDDISYLTASLACEFKNHISYDEEISSEINKILAENGIKPENVSCKKIGGRLFVEIETGIFEKTRFSEKVVKVISDLSGRKLDEPVFNMTKNSCIIRLHEKKIFKADFSVTQHACNGGKFCGDSCRCFEDGEGNFNAILSDGMGTGSSAAVEGSIVAELAKQFLKFGIGLNCALKLINSVMLFNTKSETLTTLDVLSVNLFTGEAKLIKAGSPATFVIHEGEIRKINFSSLPVGILNDVSASGEVFKLMPQDTVIMLSDGVTDIGEDWVLNILKKINTENLSEISKYIVSEAVKARSSERDDDITVLAIKISEV